MLLDSLLSWRIFMYWLQVPLTSFLCRDSVPIVTVNAPVHSIRHSLKWNLFRLSSQRKPNCNNKTFWCHVTSFNIMASWPFQEWLYLTNSSITMPSSLKLKIRHDASQLLSSEIATSLKRKYCHFDEIFITGCTGSCQNDNFQCSQWWKFRQNGDIFVSV